MYRVIDSINLRSSWLQRSSTLPPQEGPLVFLDLVVDRNDPKVPFREGSQVRVHKPDETVITLAVNRVEVNAAGVVGLFFSQLPATEIPRGALVESASTS